MPRGYLKGHRDNRQVGKKASRGGSSKKSTKKCGGKLPSKEKLLLDENDDYLCYEDVEFYFSDDEYVYFNNEGDEDETLISESNPSPVAPPISKLKQCPICCEDYLNLAPLMKNCKHAPCCHKCLREIYIIQAQQDISNYPLRCYHPDCLKPVRDTQLLQHKIVQSEKELTKYYTFTTLAKAYKHFERKVIHCPTCETPKAIGSQNFVRCRKCRTGIVIDNGKTNEYSTIAAIEAITSDKIGPNNGWARCPRCKIIVSKGYGCDHMRCVCGQDFSWELALNKEEKYRDGHGVKLATVKKVEKADLLNAFSTLSQR